MKRLILASSLIAMILLGSTLSIFWTKNYVEQSCSRLEEIYNAPAEEAASMLSDFQKEWEKKHILLGTRKLLWKKRKTASAKRRHS